MSRIIALSSHLVRAIWRRYFIWHQQCINWKSWITILWTTEWRKFHIPNIVGNRASTIPCKQTFGRTVLWLGAFIWFIPSFYTNVSIHCKYQVLWVGDDSAAKVSGYRLWNDVSILWLWRNNHISLFSMATL